MDEEDTLVVADYYNHRLMEWERGASSGMVIVGDEGQGSRSDQLDGPTDFIFDQDTDSFIVCERGNRRVSRWSRQNGTEGGEIVISNISCFGLTMDDEKSLYVTDIEKHEVRRYRKGDTNGVVVAGGNGEGTGLHQFSSPRYIAVDVDHAVYVSDYDNNRVMKWVMGAKKGTVLAGERKSGSDMTQLQLPQALLVDEAGTLYVVDCGNHRVIRLYRNETQGTVVVGGKGPGNGTYQLNYPTGLFFDRRGDLYVADKDNHRVQRFTIQKN